MLKHRFVIALVLWLPALGSHAAGAPVHEFTLENGLTLLVKEDHRAPVVISEVWYNVGSSYEHTGITGVSHVLEHMMFKGTKKHPSGEFSRIVAANGGSENAFTSRDYTGYYQQLEKSRLAVSFELEADRMRNLLLTQEEFEKELNVVKEERRLRTEDDPQAFTVEQFYATAFMNSPYQNPVIGWMNDLDNLTLDDIKQWYATWYAPNNATLVVVGDVNPQAVFELAQEYFGPLDPSVMPRPKPRSEIEQRGTRHIVVKAPAELPLLIMGYQTPTVKNARESWEPYALEVLAGILDGGDSARLATQLVRDTQVAANVGAGYSLYTRHDDLFVLSGTPSQDRTIGDLTTALKGEIDKLQTGLPSQEEMDRVKAQVVAAAVYEQDSVFYQAMQLGALVTAGLDWRLTDLYVDRIRAVTPEQVQAVAKKYLVDDRLTIAELVPLPIDKTSRRPTLPVGGSHVR
ncbi:MAG: peptidase M16 domain-containing protein [Halothiobacillaceae bacterium]|nr:MAG: peptidase M16 domain-containing protein [Halothiobacillaceae bacterium]